MIEPHKILWAEDESTLRDVMCELLRVEGYDCIGAADGLLAKEKLEKEDFDILIIDFNMPRMGGAHLLMWCRSAGIHVPVIFVTASPERVPVEELVMQDCCCSLIQKPFAVETLLEAIEEARKRNHDFECRGKQIVPLEPGNYKEGFPGQHLA